jgi:hypothetical protein
MDGRREYSSTKLETLAREKGMIIEPTIPYYLEQDNVLERAIRIIIKKARAVFNDQSIPDFLWPYIIDIVVYVINHTTMLVLEGMTL